MHARLLFTAVVATTALTLSGCGTQDDTSSGAAAATDSSSASDSSTAAQDGDGSGAAAVPEALRFTGTTVDGKPFDAATLAGKPTVLWFWAPWCPTCKAQGPETARVADRFEGKAHVIGVAGLDKPQAMKDFVTDTKVGAFPNLSDEAGDIWKKFEITEQSVYVILDKDGKTVFTGGLPAGKGLADKLSPLVG
ncbi:redoxin domain-containing protein [Streptomyces ferrugineus]|uniref:Redoxin domain-containing protein n=1 Tax=Streptomyces ferrugineus TaxID=1413221 RepID=A0A7M2SEK2_9ACTN|nr:redoxin domain-containing protein [Streptomyces ferrugineus]QOV33908.1 redoxin domain-containing protein [Streptomyces ferrugineus]